MWCKAHPSGGSSCPLDTYAKKDGPLAVGAAEEPEQEPVGSDTGTDSLDDDDRVIDIGTKMDQDQGSTGNRLSHCCCYRRSRCKS